MFDFSNYSKVDKMKDETADVAIKEFLGLEPKMYLHLLDNNSKMYYKS